MNMVCGFPKARRCVQSTLRIGPVLTTLKWIARPTMYGAFASGQLSGFAICGPIADVKSYWFDRLDMQM